MEDTHNGGGDDDNANDDDDGGDDGAAAAAAAVAAAAADVVVAEDWEECCDDDTPSPLIASSLSTSFWYSPTPPLPPPSSSSSSLLCFLSVSSPSLHAASFLRALVNKTSLPQSLRHFGLHRCCTTTASTGATTSNSGKREGDDEGHESEAVLALLEALSALPRLEQLDLSGCPLVSDAVLVDIVRACPIVVTHQHRRLRGSGATHGKRTSASSPPSDSSLEGMPGVSEVVEPVAKLRLQRLVCRGCRVSEQGERAALAWIGARTMHPRPSTHRCAPAVTAESSQASSSSSSASGSDEMLHGVEGHDSAWGEGDDSDVVEEAEAMSQRQWELAALSPLVIVV